MSAITASCRQTKGAGVVPARGTYPIKANVWIKKGGMVGLDSADRAMPAGTLAGGTVKVIGKSSAEYDNRTGSALGGGAGATDVEVEFGVFGWEGTDTPSPGAVMWASSDQDVEDDSGSDTLPIAGIFTETGTDGKTYVWMGPHAWDVAVAALAAGSSLPVQKRTVTVAHGDLTEGADDTAQAVSIGAVLPANARIVGVDMRALTPFTGGGLTAVTVDVGTTGDPDALIAAADVLTAAVDGGPADMPAGIRPNKTFATAGAQLIATFAPDSGHDLEDATAGSVIIDVLFVELA